MKKIIALLAVALLATGCTTTPKTTPTAQPTSTPTATMDSAMMKAGIGSVTSLKTADSTAEKEGSIEIDTTIASIVLDQDGEIIYVDLDETQNKGLFTATGIVNVEKTVAMPSKKVLKDDYGMAKASGIKKEWYQQAEAIEQWMVGKTVAEVIAMPVDEKGNTTDADLLTSCTISVNDFVQAVQKAADNAMDVEMATKFGVANETTFTNKDAKADAAGSIKVETSYTLVGMNDAGENVFTLIDTAENKGLFDAMGKVDTEKTVAVATKYEKKDDYGMMKASGIKKEWYQQIDSLTAWLKGKTAADVTAMTINAEGVSTDADLMTSVTIKVNDFQPMLIQAMSR